MSETALRELLDQRIVVLDGAWGTMLQGAQLKPEDFRGDLIAADHEQALSLEFRLALIHRAVRCARRTAS